MNRSRITSFAVLAAAVASSFAFSVAPARAQTLSDSADICFDILVLCSRDTGQCEVITTQVPC
jgi:hypothetical protein